MPVRGFPAVDIFRLGGIYGPGRSAFDDLRAGRARRLVKPGHTFGRIHRDDIARAVVTAMRQDRLPGRRVLNLVDDELSESAIVVTEAAKLLGVTPPPFVPFEVAVRDMSPMARSSGRRTGRSPARRRRRRWGSGGCIRRIVRGCGRFWLRTAKGFRPRRSRYGGELRAAIHALARKRPVPFRRSSPPPGGFRAVEIQTVRGYTLSALGRPVDFRKQWLQHDFFKIFASMHLIGQKCGLICPIRD